MKSFYNSILVLCLFLSVGMLAVIFLDESLTPEQALNCFGITLTTSCIGAFVLRVRNKKARERNVVILATPPQAERYNFVPRTLAEHLAGSHTPAMFLEID